MIVQIVRLSIYVHHSVYDMLNVLFAEQERLQKFQIYAGSTTDVNTNTLCWKEDGQVGNSKQFKCHPKPITGRYLTIKKEGLNWDQYPLTLCEVVIVGGKFVWMGYHSILFRFITTNNHLLVPNRVCRA